MTAADHYQHCLDIKTMSAERLQSLLNMAAGFLKPNTSSFNTHQQLKGKVICLAFFEPSTRTRMSFELAAKHCGAEVITFDAGTSALKKGESLEDTVDTLLAMGIDAVVIRDKQDFLPHDIAAFTKARAHIINAGDGCHEHPSQALLDMLTIQQSKPDFASLSVAICGDIRHSRVAGSDFLALKKLGVSDIRLVGPEALLPEGEMWASAERIHDMDAGLRDVDVIMTLRIQRERLHSIDFPDPDSFFKTYGLSEARVKLAKPDAIVMHPGPMNRGIEIAADVADGAQSVILPQVRNGVAARMAIFTQLMG